MCEKALRAGFTCIVSRSAVTTEAVRLAQEAGYPWPGSPVRRKTGSPCSVIPSPGLQHEQDATHGGLQQQFRQGPGSGPGGGKSVRLGRDKAAEIFSGQNLLGRRSACFPRWRRRWWSGRDPAALGVDVPWFPDAVSGKGPPAAS
jgi:hypothetical protein